MINDKMDRIFSILDQEIENPKTELVYTNEFTLLVAIILSAQSTDAGVNKATSSLFKVIKSPDDLLQLGIEGLKHYIKTIGLYNSKAKNLIALASTLKDKPIPKTIEELEELPGVGSKTARVFLNCAYDYPVIAVDTHVFRVSKRLGLTHKDNIKAVERELNLSVPEKWKIKAHHLLILHGRYTCKARSPLCKKCNLTELCDYYKAVSKNNI